jgi:hypothetical protein
VSFTEDDNTVDWPGPADDPDDEPDEDWARHPHPDHGDHDGPRAS